MPSTVIRRFEYSESRGELTICFTSGDDYRYFEVPPQVAQGLANAFSKGRYFAEHIRERYPCRRISRRGRPDEWPVTPPSR